MPQEGVPPKFAQLYIHDTDHEKQLDNRMSVVDRLDREILSALQAMTNRHNPHVRRFVAMASQHGTDHSVRMILKVRHCS
jgi:hypothetical protein